MYEVPKEIKKWNWGAFMFNALWGIGNKTYLPLLCFIPGWNVIWMFVCGAKGNEWAWRDGDYQDVETFKKVQETWNRSGFVSFLIGLGVVVFYVVVFMYIFDSVMTGRY